nr:hypothetical protein [Roseobacter insulae]
MPWAADVGVEYPVDVAQQVVIGLIDRESPKRRWFFIVMDHHDIERQGAVSLHKPDMRMRHACIGINPPFDDCRCCIAIGIEDMDTITGHAGRGRRRALKLVADHSKTRMGGFGDRPIPCQSQRVTPRHQKPVRQRPDRAAEQHRFPALRRDEEPGAHPPLSRSQAGDKLGKFGFDRLER